VENEDLCHVSPIDGETCDGVLLNTRNEVGICEGHHVIVKWNDVCLGNLKILYTGCHMFKITVVCLRSLGTSDFAGRNF
jgi:hypothetical protein